MGWGWWKNTTLCIVLSDLNGSIQQQQMVIKNNCQGQEWFRRVRHDTASCTCNKPSSKHSHCAAWSCHKLPYGVDKGMLAFEKQYRYAEDIDVSTWKENYQCVVGGNGV